MPRLDSYARVLLWGVAGCTVIGMQLCVKLVVRRTHAEHGKVKGVVGPLSSPGLSHPGLLKTLEPGARAGLESAISQISRRSGRWGVVLLVLALLLAVEWINILYLLSPRESSSHAELSPPLLGRQ